MVALEGDGTGDEELYVARTIDDKLYLSEYHNAPHCFELGANATGLGLELVPCM